MVAPVIAILPNAGLANKLFVWAKAQAFGRLNGRPAYTIGWSYPQIGPLLRGQRSLRLYARFFERSSGRALSALAIGRLRGRVDWEPACARLAEAAPDRLAVFRQVPPWRDYFGDLRDHRAFLRERLFAAVRAEQRRALDALARPEIALHVRMGDFRRLQSHEDFARVGGVRTPTDWFAGVIAQLRAAAGFEAPVTLFSDGSDAELASLLALPHVARSRAPNDVLDLLSMSRARVIVASAGSTFSEWAGFLSEAAIIRHPDHIHGRIRPLSVEPDLYEGPPPAGAEDWRRLWGGAPLAGALAPPIAGSP